MIQEEKITQRMFMISYDLKDSKKFGGDYRDKILTFLFFNGIISVVPFVGSTFGFYCSTTKNLEFWKAKIKEYDLRTDIYYTLNEVAQDDKQSYRNAYFKSISFRDKFNEDSERIEKNLDKYFKEYFSE